MFQLWSLVLLCGLITGTESLLENLGGTLKNVDATNLVSGDVLQNLNLDTNLDSVKDSVLGVLNSVDLDLSQVLSLPDGLKLQLGEFKILDLKFELSPDGKGIKVTLPVATDISTSLPLIGSMTDAAVSLDLSTTVSITTDSETGLPVLSVGHCSADVDNISFSLLGRKLALVNRILDSVSQTLKNTVSFVLQKEICPLVDLITGNLHVELVQNLLYGHCVSCKHYLTGSLQVYMPWVLPLNVTTLPLVYRTQYPCQSPLEGQRKEECRVSPCW